MIAQAERKGASRYAIAKAAGMKVAQLGRIADGENTPRIDTCERILAAIGVGMLLKKHKDR
jgi:DNA-binding phage protein